MPTYQIGHLNGCTVAILADGNVLPQQVVVDGVISLTENYAKVTIGLPYHSDLETMNIEAGLKDGTMQGRKVKIGNVTFRVTDTRGGWIGPNEDNIYDAFPAKMPVDPLELFSGDIRFPLGSGYEDGGRVFYRQVDPTPVSINAIIPEVSTGGATQ